MKKPLSISGYAVIDIEDRIVDVELTRQSARDHRYEEGDKVVKVKITVIK